MGPNDSEPLDAIALDEGPLHLRDRSRPFPSDGSARAGARGGRPSGRVRDRSGVLWLRPRRRVRGASGGARPARRAGPVRGGHARLGRDPAAGPHAAPVPRPLRGGSGTGDAQGPPAADRHVAARPGDPRDRGNGRRHRGRSGRRRPCRAQLRDPAACHRASGGRRDPGTDRRPARGPNPGVSGSNGELYLDICPPGIQQPEIADVPNVQRLRPGGFDGGRDAALPGWVADLPARPTVYVTMGTVFNKSAEVFGTVLDGLRDEDVNVIVTVGETGDPALLGPQPDHVHVERYIPQSQLLPHCDLLVSHAGSGAMLGALAAGVPMLAVPQGADQFVNAEAIVAVRCRAAVAAGGAHRGRRPRRHPSVARRIGASRTSPARSRPRSARCRRRSRSCRCSRPWCPRG